MESNETYLEKLNKVVDATLVEVRELLVQAKSMRALLDDHKLREQAIRDVHKLWKTSLGLCCSECRDLGGNLVTWPCDTIRVLGETK